jgi:hypothetical protein
MIEELWMFVLLGVLAHFTHILKDIFDKKFSFKKEVLLDYLQRFIFTLIAMFFGLVVSYYITDNKGVYSIVSILVGFFGGMLISLANNKKDDISKLALKALGNKLISMSGSDLATLINQSNYIPTSKDIKLTEYEHIKQYNIYSNEGIVDECSTDYNPYNENS